MKEIVIGFIVGFVVVGFATILQWVRLDKKDYLKLAEIGGHQYVVAILAYGASGGISVTHHSGCPACVGQQDQKKKIQTMRGKVVDQPNADVRVIQTKAPDGVNTITTEIDADGFVRTQSSTCVHVLRKQEQEAK